MQFFQGKKVVVNDVRIPKIQLSSSVVVSDTFRQKMNGWLLDNFGYEFILKDGQVVENKNFLLMNPVTHQRLAKALGDEYIWAR